MNFGQNLDLNNKTKVGVIGLGDISTKVHLPILSARNDTEIVWSFDINEDNAKYIAKIFSLRLLSSNTALSDFPEVDVILMAIPPTQRQTYLEFFVKSNIAFLIHDAVIIDLADEDRYEILNMLDTFSNTRLGTFKVNTSIGKNLGEMKELKL